MLSREENDRLTRVGPGTPAGALLRRFWHPVATVADLAQKPKLRVRLLAEDFVLFRDGKGRLGLVEEHCPHRRASLYYGFVEEDGIRCAYHGWKFDCRGACIEMPFEPANTPLKNDVPAKSHRVQELAGLIFAYIGPEPVPLLPRWEILVAPEMKRSILQQEPLNCNWLQVMENSVDPTHTHFLHGRMMAEHGEDRATFHYRKIEGVDFELRREANWAGILKKRVFGDVDLKEAEGHPVIFPTILLLPPHPDTVMHFRVPIDDTTTTVYRLRAEPCQPGEAPDDGSVPVKMLAPMRGPDGDYRLTSFQAQDGMAWETQGPITNRNRELLGSADRGIVMFRRLLREQIDAVAAGKDPVGVVRDPELNRCISIELSKQQEEFRRQRLAAGLAPS